MEKWTELRTAYQVARLGTVSAASRELGLHRATVNRHIDALENEFGEKIFIRNAKGYTLTELGEELLKVAQKADELLDDLMGRVQGRRGAIEGEIKITSLLSLTPLLLKPIGAFREAHPHCQVTITSTEDLQRLEYGEAHIALRAGAKPEHPDYVVRLFGHAKLNLYAHARYIARRGRPKDKSDFMNHEFVLPPRADRRVPIWSWLSGEIGDVPVAVSASDPIVVRDAVLAGLGIGILSEHDARDFDDIVPVLLANDDWTIPLWLVTHVDLHRTEKVQEMLRHLKSAQNQM